MAIGNARFYWTALATFILGCCLSAHGNSINFDNLSDGTMLTSQYSGLTFSNAIVLTAGISLNEFEFPPHSGTNVLSDFMGPISIIFKSSLAQFGAYFTYSQSLTLEGFNANNVLVASTASAFQNNEAISGNPGSHPNEFLQLTSTSGISKVVIVGSPTGGSFTMDDMQYKPTVPEPSTIVLVLSGLALMKRFRKRQD